MKSTPTGWRGGRPETVAPRRLAAPCIRGTRRTAELCARALPALLLLLLAGCSGGGGPGEDDAGAGRDATIVDAPHDGGGLPPDGAARDAAPDAGVAACPSGACDPRDASSCPGEACTFVSGEPACVAEAGMVEEGEGCFATAECAAGLACFRRRDRGICARVCCPGDADVCVGATACVGTSPLFDGETTDYWHCVGPRPCDPLAPAAVCEPGEGCYIVSPEGATDCRRAGSSAVGEGCESLSDCAPGLFCGGLVERTCSRICAMEGSTAGCPPGEGECIAYSHSPPGTGICTPASMAAAR